MINHARTLLLNVDGDASPLGAYPGDEYVDPAFRAVSLPGHLQTLRTYLFGAGPDRYLLNYRIKQLITLLHATPLEEYLLALDPRITYDSMDTRLLTPGLFTPQVIPQDGLAVIGAPQPPDASGRMYHAFSVQVQDDSSIVVSRLVPPLSKTVFESQSQVSLTGSGYSALLTQAQPGQSWSVDILNRPALDVGTLAANLASVSEPVLLQLFGLQPVEPYATFARLWQSCKQLPLKLAGLLTAIIYRTEEARA